MDSTVPINDKLEIVKNSCDKAKHEEKDRCVQKTDMCSKIHVILR